MQRARWLLSSLSIFACAGDSPEPAFSPIERTLAELRAQIDDGTSCRAIVRAYAQLHAERDPELRAFVTWNEAAAADAERLDAVPAGERGPLHCAPIVVKDNIDVAGLPTTGGVRALARSVPGEHAVIVARLVDAGAVVLGKTNLPDFALDGVNTLSSARGQTDNPYAAGVTVYGSSGGTAAALAASLGVVGLGTDTFGSLVQPASATGLVAIRPTQGLVSGAGVLPLMSLQDTPGPMARTVADAAALLAAIADGPAGEAYTRALDPDGLVGLTIGFDPLALQAVPLLGLTPDPEVADLFTASLAAIEQAGATTRAVEVLAPQFASLQAAVDGSFACMPVDFKQSLDAYLAALGPAAPRRDLAEILATGEFLPSVQDFVAGAAAQTDSIAASAACTGYQSARQAAQAGIVGLMDDRGLDLLVYPAANQPPFAAGEAPPAGWYGFQALSSPTGLPSLSLPMGLTASGGLPVGLILLARPGAEALLIQAAFALEQRQAPRVPPP